MIVRLEQVDDQFKYLHKHSSVALLSVFTGKVIDLERISEEEDKLVLAAEIIILLENNISKAETLLLKSKKPTMAIQLRKLLHHWEEALDLGIRLGLDNREVEFSIPRS